MKRPTVIAPFTMPELVFERLVAGHAVCTEMPSAENIHLETIRGVAVSSHGRVDGDFMDYFHNLEIVSNLGVGYENIDVSAALDRGIMVTHTPDVLSDDVADLAVGLLLCTVRRLPQASRFLLDGQWAAGSFPLTSTLKGRRIGLLGYGRIGAFIAQRLAAFPVELAYSARTQRPNVTHPYYQNAVALADACDILIVTVPGGRATDGLIDAEVLEALGASGILINVSRGTVVDEDALIAALNDGVIEAAGLDVFVNEPHVRSDLLALDSVVALPHLGSATRDTRRAMGNLMIENLTSWFKSGRAVTPVPECR